MDPRLRAAVDASVAWYDDVFALHGVPVAVDAGLWVAQAPPPVWHSAVKTLVPDVELEAILHAMELHPHASVADSFGTRDLAAFGFDLLIDATWLHRPASMGEPTDLPPGWSVVAGPDVLAAWNEHHETTEVLLPDLLDHPHFTFLARHEDDLLTGGAVLHAAGPVSVLSNCWSVPGRDLDLGAAVGCVDALRPDLPTIDYAWGLELEEMQALGFSPLGPQRVWVR